MLLLYHKNFILIKIIKNNVFTSSQKFFKLLSL